MYNIVVIQGPCTPSSSHMERFSVMMIKFSDAENLDIDIDICRMIAFFTSVVIFHIIRYNLSPFNSVMRQLILKVNDFSVGH